jgi:hypothetical protein
MLPYDPATAGAIALRIPVQSPASSDGVTVETLPERDILLPDNRSLGSAKLGEGAHEEGCKASTGNWMQQHITGRENKQTTNKQQTTK